MADLNRTIDRSIRISRTVANLLQRRVRAANERFTERLRDEWTPTLAANAAALPPEGAQFAASLRFFGRRSNRVSAAARTRGRALRAWASPRSRGRPRNGPAALTRVNADHGSLH